MHTIASSCGDKAGTPKQFRLMPQPTPPSSTQCRCRRCVAPLLTPSWLVRLPSSPMNVSSSFRATIGSMALPLCWSNLLPRRMSILRNETSRQVRELLTRTKTQFPQATYCLLPSLPLIRTSFVRTPLRSTHCQCSRKPTSIWLPPRMIRLS